MHDPVTPSMTHSSTIGMVYSAKALSLRAYHLPNHEALLTAAPDNWTSPDTRLGHPKPSSPTALVPSPRLTAASPPSTHNPQRMSFPVCPFSPSNVTSTLGLGCPELPLSQRPSDLVLVLTARQARVYPSIHRRSQTGGRPRSKNASSPSTPSQCRSRHRQIYISPQEPGAWPRRRNRSQPRTLRRAPPAPRSPRPPSPTAGTVLQQLPAPVYTPRGEHSDGSGTRPGLPPSGYLAPRESRAPMRPSLRVNHPATAQRASPACPPSRHYGPLSSERTLGQCWRSPCSNADRVARADPHRRR